MTSIIPSPGPVPGAPNLGETITIDDLWQVGAAQYVYSTTAGTLFREKFEPDPDVALSNAGTLWNSAADSAWVLLAFNFGTITNKGLAVAQSGSGNAVVFEVSSSWFFGLDNTGRVIALSSQGGAVGVRDWSPGAELTNSGLIAASGGTRATAVSRQNGGDIVNSGTGSILAEGGSAVAISTYGHYADPLHVDIDNAGRIQAVSTGEDASIGILALSMPFHHLRIVNSGVIDADFAVYSYDATASDGSHEILVNAASGQINGGVVLARGDDVVINHGAISGNVDLGSGADTLSNQGAIEGNIDLGAGDDRFDNSHGQHAGSVSLGWGHDVFTGSQEAAVLTADRGDDALLGGDGADLLLGGRGNDGIRGGAGNDGLYGEWGDDVLEVEGGDHALAGEGNDRIELQDTSFAMLDGGAGRDVLVLPDTALVLDLQAVLASGRIAGCEEIALPGAQELVIREQDAGAMNPGQRLFVSTGAAARIDLVGSWDASGSRTINGVSYREFVSGDSRVLVQGDGTVAILSSAPPGAVGLVPVAAGPVAPLPGTIPGVDLTSSLTDIGRGLGAPQLIEADETWRSTKGGGIWVSDASSSLPYGQLVNNGRVVITGATTKADVPYLAVSCSTLVNTGSISIAATGTDAALAAMVSSYATYGLDGIGGHVSAGSAWASSASDLVNTGTISASSDVAFAFACRTGLLDGRNEGVLSATSSRFVAAGIYSTYGAALVNTGEILAEGARGAYGIAVSESALNLDNQGLIRAIATRTDTESVGVHLYGQVRDSVIRNSGTIEADIAIELRLSSGSNLGSVRIENSGWIHGRIELAGPGQDYIVNRGSIDGEVKLGPERDVYLGTGGTQTGAVHGQSGADMLVGSAGGDALFGDEGDDLLQGGGGADTLTGGSGRDVFRLLASDESRAGARDLITDFTSGADRIDISALVPLSVTLSATDGATILSATTPDGVLTVRINGAVTMADLIVDAPANVFGTEGDDVVVAPSQGSSLDGLAGADLLIGGASADVLDGGTGADVLIGWGGDDVYHVDDKDSIREFDDGGVDTVAMEFHWAGYTLPENVEHAFLVTGSTTGLAGNAADNRLTGNEQTNVLDGGGGADTLIGGAAGDVYFVDEAADVLVEGIDGGEDSVNATGSFTLPDNVEHLSLKDAVGAIDGGGNKLANRISGNASDNAIRAGSGNDTIHAWSGADVIDGNAGADEIYAHGEADTVRGGDGDDVIWGERGADLILGGAGDDQLSGVANWYYDLVGQQWRRTTTDDATENTIRGGVGNDTVEGGDGADGLFGDAGADSIEGGIGSDRLDGGEGADRLRGGDGADTVFGRDGADLLWGDVGSDTLAGGTGADTLRGGDSDDCFVFDAPLLARQVDHLLDFAPGTDRLQLDRSVFTLLAAGESLGETQFLSGAGAKAAQTADQRIVYDSASGAIYYDSDGAGGAAAFRFAVLGSGEHPALLASDFQIVG